MSFLVRIIAFSLVALLSMALNGEERKIPAAREFPVTHDSLEPLPAAITQPPAQFQTPTERELVSILKRKLPAANEPIAVRDAPEWCQNLMQRIVREHVPTRYVQDKDWGKTDKRWDGLKVQRNGWLRVTTRRRWKEVNHGTWKRYEITQIDPNENLTLQIDNVRDAGKGKVGFDVSVTSKLHVHGRTANWAKGVQLYSVSADADAQVQMRLSCEVGMKLDILKFPPDVVLIPEVTRADLDVTDFQLQSVSKLEGPVVKQFSKSVHSFLLDKIEEKRDQLPKKINRQIAKNEDKMRLSFADFASKKWSVLTKTDSAIHVDADETPSAHISQEAALEAVTEQPAIPEPESNTRGFGLIDLLAPSEEALWPHETSAGPILVGPENGL